METASCYQQKIKIPTYKLLKDNLNPIFDREKGAYPYTLQDYKSNQKEEVIYKAVILENEYIKLTVLPELGGRLFAAEDKRFKREIFYKNSVIKPRMIARRGAWFSGGVEYNFTISHSPTTMDRVNYQLKNNKDGSAAVVFGAQERITYMNWEVELILRPGQARLEQEVKIYNPTPYQNRYYFWTNAAIEYTSNMKLIYPFDWSTTLKDTDYIKWPFVRGRDYTDPANIPSSYETFGKILTDNFFSVYDFQKDSGVVHCANRKMVKGAKFFLWGNDGRAEAWNRALNDDNTEYLEIQSGPFESQRVFKFLQPYSSLSWTEHWYLVSGMEGFKYAVPELALNFKSSSRGLKVVIAPVEHLEGCRLYLNFAGRTFEKEVNLDPEELETIEFELGKPWQGQLFEFDIYCQNRHLVNIGKRNEFSIEYPDEDVYEDVRTKIDEEFKAKLYNFGRHLYSLARYNKAREVFHRNLEQNPGCILTRHKLGSIYLKQRHFDRARKYFEEILQYDNRDYRARFKLAITEKEAGNIDKARRLLLDIAADADCYQASVVELAKIDLIKGYYREAVQLLENLNLDNSNYVLFLLSIAYRKDGLPARAIKILQQAENWDQYVLAERFQLSGAEEDAETLIKYCESDSRCLLPVLTSYLEFNCFCEAQKLQELFPEKDLKLDFISAVINGNNPEQALKDNSLDHIFINNRYMVKILEEYRNDDNSGRIDYLLGNYYYNSGAREKALGLFQSAYESGLRYTVLLRNLGYIYFKNKPRPEQAEQYLEEDLEKNGSLNEQSLVLLNDIYSKLGKKKEREGLLPYLEKAENRSLVLRPLIEILMDSGQEDKAIDLLHGEEFENWEFEESSGGLYKDVMIDRALKEMKRDNYQQALDIIKRVDKYPENLNYGDSAFEPLARIHYYRGLIYDKVGKPGAALQEFKKGALEVDNTLLEKKEKDVKYARKCMNEYRKRMQAGG
ncbi:MAG: DUF5107 domain-containing protein [Halanaerobiales bacterium]